MSFIIDLAHYITQRQGSSTVSHSSLDDLVTIPVKIESPVLFGLVLLDKCSGMGGFHSDHLSTHCVYLSRLYDPMTTLI
jgi:hypothetical protein